MRQSLAGRRDRRRARTARDGLVRDRTALIQREKHAALPLLRRLAARALRLVDAQIAEVDAAIADRIAADPALARRQDILVSMPSGRLHSLPLLRSTTRPVNGRLLPIGR